MSNAQAQAQTQATKAPPPVPAAKIAAGSVEAVEARISALNERRAKLAGEHRTGVEAMAKLREDRSEANVNRHIETLDAEGRKKADGRIARLDAKIRKGEGELSDLSAATEEIDRLVGAEQEALALAANKASNARAEAVGLLVAHHAKQYEKHLAAAMEAYLAAEKCAVEFQLATGDLAFSRPSFKAQAADRLKYWLQCLGQELEPSRMNLTDRKVRPWCDKIMDSILANRKPE